jgi:ribose transport system ATP-binding protein
MPNFDVDPISASGARELRITGLTKRFGRNTVLGGIDLVFRRGEFVGLMGPNGAGKSTLIKILAGVYTASSGVIEVGGEAVSSLRGRTDVAFIHQDLGLVEALPIVDNLRLGEASLRLVGPILDHRKEKQTATAALELVGLAVPVHTPVAALAPGEKTLVAVARALARGAEILFVDEATSTLPPGDASRVIASLKKAAATGRTVVMVTHKLVEILDATDRVVVLLDGDVAADEATAGLDRAALVRLLLQQEGVADTRRGSTSVGAALLRLHGARGGKVGPIDLTLHAGEVVGITGLPGSGLHDLAFLASGMIDTIGGRVERCRPDLRIGVIPPHRETQGGLDAMSVRENLAISALSKWRSRVRLLSRRLEHRDAESMSKLLDVRPDNVDGHYDALSGGNKQKVLFGRLLLAANDVFVLCEPTRGVDVGTRHELYQLVAGLRDRGAAVLVVTSDVEDLFGACDRVGVVVDGRLGAVRPVADVPAQELELMV